MGNTCHIATVASREKTEHRNQTETLIRPHATLFTARHIRGQTTRADLLRAPFHASEDTASRFLRNLRALRFHAFATSAMKLHRETRDAPGGHSGESAGFHTGGISWPNNEGDDMGVSQWQERRHTLNKVGR